jgi:hypothetical protein
MGPDHEYIIYVTEPTCGLKGHPAECHLLRVYYEEDVNDSMDF